MHPASARAVRPRSGPRGVLAAAALALACTPRSTPTPAASAELPAAAPAPDGGGSAPDAGPASTPTLLAQPFAPKGPRPDRVFRVDGGVVVTARDARFVLGDSGQVHVGRVQGDAVEWIDAAVPHRTGAGGPIVVTGVQGRWKDRLDLLYYHANSRAPAPSYFPLTGKGAALSPATAGGYGEIFLAEVGDTTLAAVFASLAMGTTAITNQRGPPLARKVPTGEDLGCKEGGSVWPAGLRPVAFASTPGGQLLMVGERCRDGGAAIAVAWDAAGASRVVPLEGLVKGFGDAALIRGRGEDLYLFPGSAGPVLRFHEGAFAEAARPPAPFATVFGAANGDVYGSDGERIVRLTDGGWIVVAQLAWPARSLRFVAADDGFWASADEGVFRMVPASLEVGPACATPFVHLYDVSPKSEPGYTFPATRKALASFEGASALRLVDFREGGARRLGVEVASKQQGEALLAHLATAMKDESPRLVCYAPKDPRVVALAR